METVSNNVVSFPAASTECLHAAPDPRPASGTRAFGLLEGEEIRLHTGNLRIAGAEKVGKHKTSTLQDVEAGRAIEIDALIGSVKELGELTGVATPHIDAVYALMTLLAKTMQTAHAKIVLEPVPEEVPA